MKLINTNIDDLFLIEPDKFDDNRGYFMEVYNKKTFYDLTGVHVDFVQDNFSVSKKNVLRGIHFQEKPFEQAKFIRVSEGEIFDVAVDLRKESSTYLNWFGVKLSKENSLMMFIPKGFGHAFLTLSDFAHVNYKTDNFYNAKFDRCIIWDDPKININWPTAGKKTTPIISKKDLNGMSI